MSESMSLLPVLAGAIVLPWIYFDAARNKIGKVPDVKSFTNMSAGLWASSPGFICLALYGILKRISPESLNHDDQNLILALAPVALVGILYLLSRKTLLDRAKAAPVETKHRIPKLILLAVFGAIVAAQQMH